MKLPKFPSSNIKLPQWDKSLPKFPLRNMKQFSQGAFGKGQGFWGNLAPKMAPMQNRKKAK